MEECRYCGEHIDFCKGYDGLNAYIDQKHIVLNFYTKNGDYSRAVPIMYCPMCGRDLKELYCKECHNYNIGDGVNDLSVCDNCKCK